MAPNRAQLRDERMMPAKEMSTHTKLVSLDGKYATESPESQRRVIKLRFAFVKEYGKVKNSGAMNEDAVDGVPTFP